jgi:DNA-directed RNA polymerase subunit M/transcription elongation factor TFIIS
MNQLPTTCIHCGGAIEHRQDKPGKINECAKCGLHRDVPRVGGNMIWTSKQAPEIEIKSLTEARSFARKTKRFGAGVTRSIVQSKLEPGENFQKE